MLRWATPDDADELADVHVSTWQRAYETIFTSAFLDGLDRRSRSSWWRRFIENGARVRVSGTDRVVGFCHAGSSDDQGWGEVFAIYVHPEHWGDGHGYALLRSGEATLVSLGHQRGLLWVLEGNDRGRRFYERQGWSVGKPIRIEEIGGLQVTELRYEKDLSGGP
ncbi:MAG TPA: GNAT family N-acetyltransferase [Acidimicrobiia bacterium]|nr:GNAT family N-acetyltransferase [Acidimicrobiia bacterium]